MSLPSLPHSPVRRLSASCILYQLVAALLLFGGAAAPAATYYNITFEEPVHHLNEMPATGGAPDKVSSILGTSTAYSSQGDVYTPPIIVPAPAGLSGQALKLLTSYPHLQRVERGITLEPASGSGNVTMSFDLVTQLGGAGFLDVQLGGRLITFGYQFKIYDQSNGKVLGSYADGALQRVSIELAPDIGLFIGKINGREVWREPYTSPNPPKLSFRCYTPFAGNRGQLDAFLDSIVIADTAELNQSPTFTRGPDVVAPEDSPYSQPWATDITAGANEPHQSVAFQVTNDRPGLFTVEPTISPAGVLAFTPAPNAFGRANVTVLLVDTGGTANGGSNASATQTFAIDIANVNDAPTLDPISDFSVRPNSAEHTVNLTGISVGPSNEAATLVVSATSSAPEIMATPQITYSSPDATGTLKLAPAPGAVGDVTITVTVAEADAPGVQVSRAFVVKVTDNPTFNKGPDLEGVEDVPFTAANWPTAVSIGAADPQDPITFEVTTDNPALFSAGPTISPSGQVDFTSAKDVNGRATATVRLRVGSLVSDPQSFVIDIAPVDDRPTLTAPATLTVYNDREEKQFTVTNITPGPNETGNLHVYVSVYDGYNNITYPTVTYARESGTAVVKFTPRRAGTVTLTVSVDQDPSGPFNYAYTKVEILQDPDAQKPTFTPLTTNITVPENSGRYEQPWATNIVNSHGTSSTADLRFAYFGSSGSAGLFSSPPTVGSDGVLSFTPALNATGTFSVTLELWDESMPYGDPIGHSVPVTLTITIGKDSTNPAPPRFTPGANVSVAEDSGVYSQQWATQILNSPGKPFTGGLSFSIQSDVVGLFSQSPAITADGVLTFKPMPQAAGIANLTVTLIDSSQPPGSVGYASAPVNFIITVTSVNDAPVFTAGPSITVAANAGPKVYANWATGIRGGPAAEGTQPVHFVVSVNHPEYFAVPPAISPDGTLSFEPKKAGTVAMSVYLQDEVGDQTPTFLRTIEITDPGPLPKGDYRGLVQAPAGEPTLHKQAGLVNLTVTAGGNFTGRVTLHQGQVRAFRGRFSENGGAMFLPERQPRLRIKVPGLPVLDLQLGWSGAPAAPAVDGALLEQNGALYAKVSAGAVVFTAARNPVAPLRNVPAALLGRYTVTLTPQAPDTGETAQANPTESSVATITVGRSGIATLVGRTPDQRSLAYAGAVLGDLSYPVYIPIAGGRGSLSGYVHFREVPDVSDVDAPSLHWSSPATRARAAWDGVEVGLVGSK